MIERLYFYFNSLEKREKYLLSFGIIFVIVFIGVFFITVPHYQSVKKTEEKLYQEIEKYNELRKLAGIYRENIKLNRETEPLTLAKINRLSEKSGVKEFLQSIRPVEIQGMQNYEVILKEISPEKLSTFIHNIKQEGYKIYFLSVENPAQNQRLNVRVVLGD